MSNNCTAKVIGYLPVSAAQQDVKETRAAILAFAKKRKLGKVEWLKEKVAVKVGWKERELARAVDSLEAGDWLIIPEFARLGRTTLDVLDLLAELNKKEVNVHAIKGNWTLDDAVDRELFTTMAALFSEIDHELLSLRTQEVLKARKAAGVRLGRPPGPGKSKLDPYRSEIENLLRNGSKLNFIAKRYKVTVPTLINWITKNNIDRTPQP